MKPLDKKQIPQFAALCVLTAGVAGYLVIHLAAPGPVSAGTRPTVPVPATPVPAAPASPGTSTPPGSAAASAATASAKPEDDAASTDAPPPSPGMHDPFAVGYVDPASLTADGGGPAAPALPKLPTGKPAAGIQTAGIHGLSPMPVSFSEAPALPGGLSGFPGHSDGAAPGLPAAPAAPALPAGPAAPTWTVTGVLQGASGKVAILRSGEARRIVRSGDFVDSTYRVVGVTRTSVTLRHGTVAYQLVLGASKTAPAKPGIAPAGLGVPPAAPPMPQEAARISPEAAVPVYRDAHPEAALAHLHRQGVGPTLAQEEPLSPLKVANSIRLGLRLLDGSVLSPDQKSH